MIDTYNSNEKTKFPDIEYPNKKPIKKFPISNINNTPDDKSVKYMTKSCRHCFEPDYQNFLK